MEKFLLDKNTPQKSEASNEKNGKEISRRDFLKKAAEVAGTAAGIGVVAALGRFSGPSDEELEKMDKKKAEERRRNIEGEPDIMGRHLENKYAGYVDLEHFLEDHPEIKEGSSEFEKAKSYFNSQGKSEIEKR
jgi:hypothetical protein